MTENYTAIETPIGLGILDENSDGHWIAAFDYDWSEEQVDYAITLLNAGVEQGDLTEMVLYTNCVSCEGTFMQAQLDGSKRCFACAP